MAGDNIAVPAVAEGGRKRWPCLIAIAGPAWGRLHVLDREEVLIGRGKDCDVQISDASISRRHAQIRVIGPESIELIDLGSKNGVHVNSNKIDRHILKSGDVVKFDDKHSFRFDYISDAELQFHEDMYSSATRDDLYDLMKGQLSGSGMEWSLSLAKPSGTGLTAESSDIDEPENFYLSLRFKDLLGWRDVAEPFTYWRARIHPDHHDDVIAALRAHISQRESFDQEYPLLHADGHYVWVQMRGVMAFDALGRPTLMSGTLTDVTDRRRAELAQADSRAKSELLAVISHEIRTPMTGILGMARLMLDESLPAAPREHMEVLKSSAEALLSILDGILDFSKLEAGRLEFERIPFPLQPTVTGVVSLMTPRALEKGLSLSTDIDASLAGWVSGDAGRLRQVLVNLVSNAIKFTSAGSVTLRVSRGVDDEIEFSVVDTGIGIDADAQAKLFQPFNQADSSIARRFGGTGLGLAICKRMVEAQGGFIGVDSEPGQGSRFWFRLALPATEPAVTSPAATPTLPPLSVLLAEDNPVNQKVALTVLTRAGHRVTAVTNGREAVAAAAAGGYDLILMDMQMPEMNGLEATKAIRLLPPPAGAVPIIALTANVLQDDIESCHAAGMQAHVVKPVSPSRLFETMAQVVKPHVDAVGSAPLADALAMVEQYLGGNAMAEIRQTFLSAGVDACRRLGDLAEGGSLDDIRRYAHSLKGMAHYVNAAALVNLTSAIEQAAHDGSDREARALIASLPDTWQMAVQAARLRP